MALDIRKFFRGLRILNNADPTKYAELNVADGFTGTKQFNFPSSGADTGQEVITSAATQTLTGKTLSTASNTVTVSGSTNKVLVGDGSGNLATSTVTTSELGLLSGLTSPPLTAADTATLTNKTMDGDNNTFQDISISSLKTNLTDASKFIVRDASGVVVSNTKAVPTGAVVGTTDTQTLTSKTIDADNNTITNIENADIKAAAGIVYSKLNLTGEIVNADINASAAIDRSKLSNGTGDHVVINDASGVLSSEVNLAITRGGTGGGTATSGFNNLSPLTTKGDVLLHNGTNNIRQPVGTDGFFLKANSSQAAGVEWASGSANLAVTSKTTTYSITTADDLILCSTTAFTVTLPTAVGNTGKVFTIKKTDSDVATIITIATSLSQTIDGLSTTTLNTEGETIKLVSNGVNWDIIDRHVPFKWTDAGVTTITATIGAPTKPAGISRDKVWWARQGSDLLIRYQYQQTNTTSATNGLGDYLFAIPIPVTIDTAKVTAITTAFGPNAQWTVNSIVGTSAMRGSASGCGTGIVSVYDTTRLRFHNISSDTAANSAIHTVGAAVGGLATDANITHSADVRVPITGWN